MHPQGTQWRVLQHDGLRPGAPWDAPARLVMEAPWPRAIRSLLESEGLVVGEAEACGINAAFEAALLRWPEEHRLLAEAIGGATGLPTRWAREHLCGKRRLPVGERTIVMGILNVTPDSFFDGGKYAELDSALARAERLVDEGADIIDVGGESTRPYADPVPAEVEKARVLPVIRELVARVDVPISIDTTKAEVAEAALAAGATMVNDVSGLRHDPEMAKVAAAYDAAVVVMHTKGSPQTMQDDPVYDDLMREVREYLEAGCELALAAGVREERIWIDPGIGFGKTVGHNLELLRSLRALRALGFPVLVGTSNKSVIGRVLNLPVGERFEGTAATVALAVANGADAVRVHDVRAMRRVSAMSDAVVRLGGNFG